MSQKVMCYVATVNGVEMYGSVDKEPKSKEPMPSSEGEAKINEVRDILTKLTLALAFPANSKPI